MVKNVSANPVKIAARAFGKPKKQAVSVSVTAPAKLPRAILVSDFQLHETKRNKLSFPQALVMGERGFGGVEVTAAEVKRLKAQVDRYLVKYTNRQLLGPLNTQSEKLPKFQESGSITPDRMDDERDIYPILTAQATGREVRILEASDGNSYKEVQVVTGHISELPGDDLSLLEKNLEQSPIYLLRTGDHYDFLEELPALSTRLTQPLFKSSLGACRT